MALRRLRRIEANFVEKVDRLEVFKRDRWICQLCGVRTKKKLMGTRHALGPQVDHIIPISKGGEHSYRNVQTACRGCNLKKRAKPLGQLRMFG